MSRHSVANAVTYDGWQQVLPNVFLTHQGELTKRQMMIAALLWAGPLSLIDARDACRFHGIKAVAPVEEEVDIWIPHDGGVRNTGFVNVRRSIARPSIVRTDALRYVDAATAVVAATRRMTKERGVLAAFSDALQRGACTEHELLQAHIRATRRHAQSGDRALAALALGARSVPEVGFADLARASTVLPQLLYNPLLQLPDGRLISPDALAVDAALVHETNGRRAHEREDLFEDMQERHEVMTVAGLTVMHSTPRQLWTNGRRIITGFETVYLRRQGRGLPRGVVLLRAGPPGSARRAG